MIFRLTVMLSVCLVELDLGVGESGSVPVEMDGGKVLPNPT